METYLRKICNFHGNYLYNIEQKDGGYIETIFSFQINCKNYIIYFSYEYLEFVMEIGNKYRN
jgi:hypothetical protein